MATRVSRFSLTLQNQKKNIMQD